MNIYRFIFTHIINGIQIVTEEASYKEAVTFIKDHLNLDVSKEYSWGKERVGKV